MIKFRFAVALFCLVLPSAHVAGSDATAKPDRCAVLLPTEAKLKLEATYKGWTILEYDQLLAHQLELWGRRCPGVAVGQFRQPQGNDYAVVIVRQINGTKQAKLVLVRQSKSGYAIQVLREEKKVPSYPVVHKEPPGEYRYIYDRKITIKAVRDVFVYEHLEATATLFYYKDGNLRKLLISD